MVGLSLLQIPGVPGGPEVLIILAIIVILFGADKVPQLAGALGQARGEFDKGRQEVEDELKEMQTNDVESEPDGNESDAPNESTGTNSRTSTVDPDSSETNQRNAEAESTQ